MPRNFARQDWPTHGTSTIKATSDIEKCENQCRCSLTSCHVAGMIAPLVMKIELLGATIDYYWSLDQHISDVVRSCNSVITSSSKTSH